LERVSLRIHGRVQGVWYRASTQKQAAALGLSGFVRNVADGSVEAVAEGPREQLEALIAWCREGPPHARVSEVESRFGDATGEFDDFRVTR
jgi:acylphosphatase